MYLLYSMGSINLDRLNGTYLHSYILNKIYGRRRLFIVKFYKKNTANSTKFTKIHILKLHKNIYI